MDSIEADRWGYAVEEAREVDSTRSVAVPSDVVLAVERDLVESGARQFVAIVTALVLGLVAGAALGAWFLPTPRA